MEKLLFVVCFSIVTYEVMGGSRIVPLVKAELVDERHLNQDHQSNEIGLVTSSSEDHNSPLHHRVRRQFVDLALNHDKNGVPRPVGKLHGLLNANGSGTRKNHNINLSTGLGAVVWRSPNKKHSVGVGASYDHAWGRNQGVPLPTVRPNIGAGIGYKFQFGKSKRRPH